MVDGAVLARARGRALLGPLRHVKEKFGRLELEGMVKAAPAVLAPVLRTRIAQGSWYPYDSYAALLRLIDRRFGRGDLAYCRTLGEWAGAQDLGSMFKVYRMLASPERLIASCKLVWPQYYEVGEMTPLSTSPTDTRLRITGFAAMDPAHCRLMEGWMFATMSQLGCHVHEGGREVTCTSRGGPHHEFACTWERIGKVTADADRGQLQRER